MHKKTIQSILEDALEKEIPSSRVNLWPAVRASLVAGNDQRVQQGEKMITKKMYRIPRFAVVIALLILLISVTLLTPQGRALSQSIFQFFRQAGDTSFPLQPSQVTPVEPDTFAPTAVAPAPFIGLSDAEAQVNFSVAELPVVPDGFNYLGARLYGDAVSIEYATPDYGGHLIIKQSPDGFIESDWDRVPAEAIVHVKIGDIDGEFTHGTFVVYPGETNATWNPDAAFLRLRWKANDIWYEMSKYGDVKAIAYLDQAGLIELAESLVIKP